MKLQIHNQHCGELSLLDWVLAMAGTTKCMLKRAGSTTAAVESWQGN
jgi:hypothetical protein